MTLSWGDLAMPPINLLNMPAQEINLAPTDQEIQPDIYKLRASPYFIAKLQKLCRSDVSAKDFNYAVREVVASHNMSVHYKIVHKYE